MISFTPREVLAVRNDPDTERTDSSVQIKVGLCTSRLCVCGNVWQPWQPRGYDAPSVTIDKDPHVDLSTSSKVAARRKRDGAFWSIGRVDRSGQFVRPT